MPLNCFGLHDWSKPYVEGDGNINGSLFQRCMSCGRVQRFYPSNILYQYEIDEWYQHQQQSYLIEREPDGDESQ